MAMRMKIKEANKFVTIAKTLTLLAADGPYLLTMISMVKKANQETKKPPSRASHGRLTTVLLARRFITTTERMKKATTGDGMERRSILISRIQLLIFCMFNMLLSIAKRWNVSKGVKKKMDAFGKQKASIEMVRILFLVLFKDRMATTNCLGPESGLRF